ncbi:hypothetical protein A1D22_10820, partial [Pasteurellaceae bacterium LFhippo2]|nr:hypothetical protein [Pasteurellaceae bacterium LFhippo2]
MNKIFKVIWNHATQSFVVTSELTKTKGKSSSSTTDKRMHPTLLALAIGSGMASISDPAQAATTYVLVPGQIPSSDSKAIAIGNTSSADANNAIAIGNASSAAASYTIAIGNGSSTAGSYAVAIGNGATTSTGDTSGFYATAIGSGTTAIGVNTTAVGASSYANGAQATAFGSRARAESAQSTAIGNDTRATGVGSISIGGDDSGSYNSASYIYNGYLPSGATVTSYRPTYSSGNGSTAISPHAQALTQGSTAIGTGATAGEGTLGAALPSVAGVSMRVWTPSAISIEATAIGTFSLAQKAQSTAVGYRAQATLEDASAVGSEAKASGVNSTSVGYKTLASGADAVSIGSESNATANRTVVFGRQANATQEDAIAIGANAQATHSGSIALGNSSITSAPNAPSAVTVNGVTYNNFAASAPVGVVSVGSAGKERQITNVAAGRITENSTDAINGSQLYTVAVQASKPMTFAGNTNSDTDTTGGKVAKDGTQRQLGDTLNIIGGTTNVTGLTRSTATATGGAYSAKNIQTVVSDGEVQIQLADNPILGSVQFGSSTGPKITSDGDNIKVGTSSGAATKITNVANGMSSNDAVNLSQLNATKVFVNATKQANVTSEANSTTGGTDYTVSATKTTVTQGSGVSVTGGTEDANGILNYTVALNQATQAQLKKE